MVTVYFDTNKGIINKFLLCNLFVIKYNKIAFNQVNKYNF